MYDHVLPALESSMTGTADRPLVVVDGGGANTESELLARHLAGDDDAFAELVQRYRAPVFSYLVRSGVAPDDRDDLFQEIFIRIHRAAASYDPSRPLHPWLFTVVANTVRNHLRRQRVRALVGSAEEVAEPAACHPAADRVAAGRQTMAWLERQIRRLPAARREVLILSCVLAFAIEAGGRCAWSAPGDCENPPQESPALSGGRARPSRCPGDFPMKCSKLRNLLADKGPAALAGNREVEDHLVDCAGCYAVLEALTELDALLPELERLDVSDETVEQLLGRSELNETIEDRPTAPAGWMAGVREHLPTIFALWARLEPARRLGTAFDRARQARLRWGIVAVPAVVLIGIVSILTVRSTMLSSNAGLASKEPYVVKQVKFKQPPGDPGGRAKREEAEAGGSGASVDENEAGREGSSRERISSKIAGLELSKPIAKPALVPDPAVDRPDPGFFPDDNLVLGVPEAPPPSEPAPMLMVVDAAGQDRDKVAAAVTDEEIERAMERSFEGDVTVTGSLIPRADLTRLSPVVVSPEPRKQDAHEKELKDLEKQYEQVAGKAYVGGKSNDAENEVSRLQSAPTEESVMDEGSLSAARRFLDTRDRIDDESFREARGYWANTYVPGDRTLRQLKARLDRTAGAGTVGSLHEGSHQISQPFDAPDGAALAVYLHADRAGVDARERMLVQIGLKATERRSGLRPAMNIGLVLDLAGEVTPEVATSMRALLGAFASSAELGDRFSLTVAGRPGGTVVAPGDLRHGPLTVAMAELFGDEASGPVLSLEEAATAARNLVHADDDPNAPLGSSALIVITSRRLEGLADRLADMAHASAVDGVPWSVIGVGSGIDLSELDALVLGGQGNRRLLTAAADADALVDRELAAVGRVVARAVRLRIRLAPGVQLVDVIGSVRLDEDRVQQVRDAEQSIDQRLSRNLGIQTDRGLDEEGIQIVIPSYYANDAHVVLLDVVVPGPGPVADVTVRYKDLVHMKNGVASAHLELSRPGRAGAGPLELNVLANLVAVEVASRLDAAADVLAGGDIEAALANLNECLDLVRGITGLVDGLAQDPDLEADIKMLVGYLGAVETLSPDDPAQIQTAVDSLRYAARLKILPPPINDAGTE